VLVLLSLLAGRDIADDVERDFSNRGTRGLGNCGFRSW
jgi:hypothetical protein